MSTIQRNARVQELDAELARIQAEHTGRPLSDEARARVTEIAAEEKQITEEKQIRALRDKFDSHAPGTPLLRDGTDRDFAQRCCEFSLFRAAAHAIGMHGVDAGREVEVQQELVRRSQGRAFTGNVVMPIEALSVQAKHLSRQRLAQFETRDVIGTTTPVGGPGGALIGTYIDPSQYIDVLRPAMAVRQAGARVLTDLRENVSLPAMIRGGAPGFFSENSAIPTTDMEFGGPTLRPHHSGAIATITRNTAQQANPEVEGIVVTDLATKIANDVDAAAIAGTGVAPQPLGIVTDPATLTQTGAALSYDGIVDLIGLLAANNALAGSLGWVGDSKVLVAGLKLKDLQNRAYLASLWQGYPQYWTNLAAGTATIKSPLIFANWADLVIGFWSSLDVLVNPYADSAYSKGNIQIRCAMTLDIVKRHAKSFAWMETDTSA